MSEKTTLEEALTRYQNMEQNLQDYSELAELAEAEGDEASLADLKRHLEDLRGEARHSELEALLTAEVDANDAFLEVPCRQRRNRSPGLGGNAVANV